MKFERQSGPPDTDSLHIKTKGKKSFITGNLTVISFRDKDTRQMVIYVPALDLSGYGEDEQKAEEMVKFSIQDFFDYLMQFPSTKVRTELAKYGWKNNPIKSKEFSHAYVDIRGNLKNFNAVGDKVEVSVLSV